jgi:hypothetical protein
MASSRPWPFDDDDRPSGSVRPLSQADLQAILAHLGDDPEELLAGTGADRPVVAVRVRATVGRPGGSAQAQWRRARAAEWTAWTRSLPWRVAATLGAAVAGAVLGSLLAGRLGLALSVLAALAAGGAAVPAQPRRYRLATRGGGGAAYRPLVGWVGAAGVGGPARPGRPRQPGQPRPPGDRPGRGLRDRLQALSRPPPARPVGAAVAWPLPLAPTLQAVSFEADQAARVLPDPGVAVVPILAVHGAQVPWGKVVVNGVPVVQARRLPSMLCQLPAVLGPERVAWLAGQARVCFHAAG